MEFFGVDATQRCGGVLGRGCGCWPIWQHSEILREHATHCATGDPAGREAEGASERESERVSERERQTERGREI